MSGIKWLTALVLLVIGGLVGAVAVIASTEINRVTATRTFCTSCHSMAAVAADPHFKQSAHESNELGIRVACSDCHIPPGNWFSETYTHVSMGLRDAISEYSHNFSDAAVWEKRRNELAGEVREMMRRDDSSTCRKCHDPTAIVPKTEAGRSAHAMLQQGGVTCVDCHMNLTHAPVATSSSPGPGSGLAAAAK
jgi:nitrate/TMAO reductase-like tetraheme cytochrome c subunit